MRQYSALLYSVTVAAVLLKSTGPHNVYAVSPIQQRFTPDWKSLDSRISPPWYDEAKVGIFIHWGVFSVPSYISEWFWWYWQGAKQPDAVAFMKANYPPDWTYANFGKDFTAEFFNATQWTDLFVASGARYIVLTTKHHEGFTLWPSNTSFNWNSVDVGPGKDLVSELEQALRSKSSLRFGVYHSLFEWFNRQWISDKENGFSTKMYAVQKAIPELYDLVNRYRPDIIWSDGDAEAPDTYWNSTGFLAWLYNDSPVKTTVVVNDRWGIGTSCKHGDFYNCADRYNPHHIIPHKWENAFTLDKLSWGYRRTMTAEDVMTIQELLGTIVSTVATNGNALINIGPRKDGIIPAIFQERLLQMGSWLKVNGEAIYGTRPWSSVNDTLTPSVWYTKNDKKHALYMHIMEWPENDTLIVSDVNATVPIDKIEMLGSRKGPIGFAINATCTVIRLSSPSSEDLAKWLWVLKLYLGSR